ncbi:MAG: hypothetical protein OXC00_09905 [Acidimicrobiaceae bacterium]|nr:hypothetical protein [Acidimicrobiaceae bacterium]
MARSNDLMLRAVGNVFIQRPDSLSIFGHTLGVPAEADVPLGKLRASGDANELRDVTAHADGRS